MTSYLSLQFKYMIFHIFICIFHLLGVHYELTMLPAPWWLDSSVGRALYRYLRGHGFESRNCSTAIIWLSIFINQYTSVILPCYWNCEVWIILQVPDSGNYTFYLSCDDWCELWKYDVAEYGIENWNKKSEESLTKQPIIALYAYTGHLQWNKWATHERYFESYF